MLPGKKYTPEDLLAILRRRIWYILVPLAAISALTAVGARTLPDRYRSETLILVVPQRVPETYVKQTVTARIEDRLHSISQQILSRTRLERIIQEFDLYAESRRTGIMEDIVERMRRDITVRVVEGDAFRIGYVGDNPRTVMRVTERLASLFIEENLRDREVLAEGTSLFLEAQLDDARRRLIEHEKKLEDYRRRFSGQLPSQQESNLRVIQNVYAQIQTVVDSMNRDRDRRLILGRQIADASAEQEAALASAAPAPAGPETAAQQLAAARTGLAGLEVRLRPDHPDIGMMKRRIAELERKAEAEALATPVTPERRLTPADIARQRRLSEMRLEMEQIDRQIAHKEQEEQRLRVVVAGYQQRVELAPTRESELIELTRDYATLQSVYTNLLSKREDSKVAANLERRQIGEQFKLLDPARVPERPFSPNRQLIIMVGMVMGLGFGVGLIGLLEYRDGSFKTDDDVTDVLSLPVLAVVPLMRSDRERRRSMRWRIMMNLGLGSTVATCLAVLVYTFVR